LVYVGSLDGNLYCLDANSGNVAWKCQTGGEILSTPTVDGNIVYLTSSTQPTDGTFLKLDASTGAVIWNISIPYQLGLTYNAGNYLLASPAVADDLGMVYVCNGFLYTYAFNITNGEIIWTYKVNSIYNSGQSGGVLLVNTPLYHGGALYMNNYYSISCIDATTGTEKWSTYLSREDVSAGITYSPGIIYAVTEAKVVYTLDAQTGAKLSYASTGGQMRSAPTPYNGNLYVGSSDWNLYCFTQTTPLTVSPASITFELRPNSIALGDIVTVAGSIDGVHSAVPMNVYFSRGDSSLPVNISAITDGNGGFTVKYMPDMVGDWTVVASWAGDTTHSAGSSQSQTLAVTEPSTPQPTQALQSAADLYFVPGIIGVIVAIIAVGAVLAILVTKKRP
jgi:outer membrane protein assembly factor BamB